MPEETEETIIEQTTETGTGETVEQLEDRLIAALERNEQLESRIATLEARLTAIEGHTHEQPTNSNPTEPQPENTSPERQPDKPPKHPHFWFRDAWES